MTLSNICTSLWTDGGKITLHHEVKRYLLALFALRETQLWGVWCSFYLCRFVTSICGTTVEVWAGCPGCPLICMKNGARKNVLSCVGKLFWPVLKPKGNMKYCISLLLHSTAVVKNKAFHWSNWGSWRWVIFQAGMWSGYWVNATATEKGPQIFQKP